MYKEKNKILTKKENESNIICVWRYVMYETSMQIVLHNLNINLGKFKPSTSLHHLAMSVLTK